MPPFDSGDDLIWIAGRGEGDDDSIALVAWVMASKHPLSMDRHGRVQPTAGFNLEQKSS